MERDIDDSNTQFLQAITQIMNITCQQVNTHRGHKEQHMYCMMLQLPSDGI